MITDTWPAWIIHKYWSGETSVKVVFFTAEQGMMRAFYKGGRSPKRQGLLQPLTPLWITTQKRNDVYFINQIEIASAPIMLVGDALFAALYVNELMYRLLRDQDQHLGLYQIYEKTIKLLENTDDRLMVEMILRRFELKLLETCGYGLVFSQDALTGAPIMPTHYYRFSPGEGFVLADKGYLGEMLCLLADDRLEEAEVLVIAKKIMRKAIDHALEGREINARKLYKESK